MFKHRDNIAYSPFTIDKQGGGKTLNAASFGQQQGQEYFDQKGVLATAAKKRPRDIRSIGRFSQVVYSDKGLPRFHAMIARNPILMYPPEGIDEARKRVKKRREEAAAATVSCVQQEQTKKNEKESGICSPAGDDDDMFFMSKEHQIVEGNGDDVMLSLHPFSQAAGDAVLPRNVATTTITTTSTGEPNDEELANYHHRQLDALIGVYYEFNHLTFMKLQMKDTLQLLQRCGREAVNHTLEFETRLRTQREARLKELDAVVAEEKELKKRQVEAELKDMERELQVAEEAQRALINIDNDSTF